MRTWVIFAFLSVIVAVAQQSEAAAVREPAIITDIDKAVKKAEALIEKVKDANKENLNKIKEGFEKLESSIKEHLPFGKKPVAETPKKNNVEGAQEETVAARSFFNLPVFKIPQINLDEIKERVQNLEAWYEERLEQLATAIAAHLPFGKKPVAASKPESPVVAEDNEVVDVVDNAEIPKENNGQQVQPESPVVAEDNEVVDNAEIPKENNGQQVQPESPVVAEDNEVVDNAEIPKENNGQQVQPESPVVVEDNEVVDNAEIPKENNGQQVQPESPVVAEDNEVVEVVDNAEIPQENNAEDAQEETVAARSFFNLPEINLDEFKERVQHLEALYQERLEQLKSSIKEHLSFGKKPVAPVNAESPVVAEDNEVVEVVDNAEIPQENNVEDAQEEAVAARSLDEIHLH